ncbi:MAG: hypothetical protein AAGA92_12550 [Planctomycetota bacterium]
MNYLERVVTMRASELSVLVLTLIPLFSFFLVAVRGMELGQGAWQTALLLAAIAVATILMWLKRIREQAQD